MILCHRATQVCQSNKAATGKEEISQVFHVYPILGVTNFLLGDTVLAEYKDYTAFQFAFMPVSLM